VNSKCDGAVVVPLILYSDQTSLSKNTKVTGHPFVMSIANITCENRYLDERHALLTVLPILPSCVLHKEQLVLFQKCLAYVLQPLKEARKQ
jgi:hypothetical protein